MRLGKYGRHPVSKKYWAMVAEGEDPEALLADELGLEPDYIDELMQ